MPPRLATCALAALIILSAAGDDDEMQQISRKSSGQLHALLADCGVPTPFPAPLDELRALALRHHVLSPRRGAGARSQATTTTSATDSRGDVGFSPVPRFPWREHRRDAMSERAALATADDERGARFA